MKTMRWLPGLLWLSLALPLTLGGQSFEGTVRQRIVTVEGEALFEIVYGGEEEEPEFDSEAEWLRYTANKLFQIPSARFTSSFADGVEVQEITLQIKGTKVRLDGGFADEGYMIYDVGAGQVWMVNPAGRYYVSYSMEEAEAAAGASAREAEEAMAAMGVDVEEMRRQAAEYEGGELDESYGMGGVAPTVKSLGRTETVNGFEASLFEAMVGDQVGLGWCAEDLSGVEATIRRLGTMAGAMEEEEEYGGDEVAIEDLLCQEAVPVRVQTYSPSMGMSGAYTIDEILSIREERLSDDLFEAPEGFEKRSLDELWGIGS
jgi:hypothetical protein